MVEHHSVINAPKTADIERKHKCIRKYQRKLIVAGIQHRLLLLEREVSGECCDLEIRRIRDRINTAHQRINKVRAQLIQSGAVADLPCDCFALEMQVKVRLTPPNGEPRVETFTVVNGENDLNGKGHISHKMMIARCLCGAVPGREFEYPIRKGCSEVGLFEILKLQYLTEQAA